MATVWTSQTEVTITGACCDYVVTIGGSELLKVKNPLILLGGIEVVAGGGIEPPTRGFSVLLPRPF